MCVCLCRPPNPRHFWFFPPFFLSFSLLYISHNNTAVNWFKADEGLGDDQGSYDDDVNGEEDEAEGEEEEEEEDENGNPVSARQRRASAAARANNKIIPIPPYTSFFILSHSNRYPPATKKKTLSQHLSLSLIASCLLLSFSLFFPQFFKFGFLVSIFVSARTVAFISSGVVGRAVFVFEPIG